jgi:hypothetical protein
MSLFNKKKKIQLHYQPELKPEIPPCIKNTFKENAERVFDLILTHLDEMKKGTSFGDPAYYISLSDNTHAVIGTDTDYTTNQVTLTSLRISPKVKSSNYRINIDVYITEEDVDKDKWNKFKLAFETKATTVRKEELHKSMLENIMDKNSSLEGYIHEIRQEEFESEDEE